MSQSTDTLKDDIAYVADLAREGGKPTYTGGEFLLFCGLLFGGTSFAVAASLAGYLAVDMNWLWLGSLIAFAIGLPILIVRSKRSGAYRMLGDRAVGQAWTAIGWAIFTIARASACSPGGQELETRSSGCSGPSSWPSTASGGRFRRPCRASFSTRC